MNAKYLAFGLISCCAFSMKRNLSDAARPTWRICKDGRGSHPVDSDDVKRVESVRNLAKYGVVESLIARPMSGMREAHTSLKLTKLGVESDHRFKKRDRKEQHIVQAVSLMRADVSQVLGGAHVPGDDIHVRGLDLSEMSLPIGALIVIKHPYKEIIKAILLKTCVEYYANDRLLKRCGENAYDLMQVEGPFDTSLHNGTNSVHGLRDRLRGVKLAVLKEGEVSVGDHVLIVTGEESEALIKKYKLDPSYQNLLTRSIPIGEKITEYNRKVKIDRYLHHWRKRQKCCCGLGYAGGAIATLAAIIFGYVLTI